MNYHIRLANENDCNKLSILKHKMWDESFRGIYSDDLIDKYDYKENLLVQNYLI